MKASINGRCFSYGDFYWKDAVDLPGNVFLPFMGIVLQDVYRKQLVKADKMMPATQMVFLELLYMDDEDSVLKSEVANKLNLTKTSITRATAQLEEMGLIRQMKPVLL